MTEHIDITPVGERRGAVIVGALTCAMALVLGYGGGLGVVPGIVGGGDNSGADVGMDDGMDDDGSSPGAPDGDGDGDTGSGRDTWGGTQPGGAGPGTTVTSPNRGPTRQVVSPAQPSSTAPPSSGVPPTSTPSTTSPSPSTSSPTSPGSTSPPTTQPPTECTGLLDDLLGGLTGYLSGPNVDAALVQQVTAVLGVVPAVGSLTGLVPEAGGLLGLVPDVRGLLGVDVTGVVTVTAGQLTDLLDAVLRGCPS